MKILSFQKALWYLNNPLKLITETAMTSIFNYLIICMLKQNDQVSENSSKIFYASGRSSGFSSKLYLTF